MSSPVSEGQAITIPLDHKLILVPNDHPDDGGSVGGNVEYPRCAFAWRRLTALGCSAGMPSAAQWG